VDPPVCFGKEIHSRERREEKVVILKKRVIGLTETGLDRFLQRARRAVGLTGGVNVLVTTSRELRSLNRRFRGKDQFTDVLSFPAVPQLQHNLAGDLAISADIASQNGKRLGHSAAEEVKILVLHGVLHLAGYDHESDNGAMARKEERLRRQLKLPAGLIERNNSPSGRRRR
jgi:probable rRNA maturation factor